MGSNVISLCQSLEAKLERSPYEYSLLRSLSMTEISDPSSEVLSVKGCAWSLDEVGFSDSSPRRAPSSRCSSIVKSWSRKNATPRSLTFFFKFYFFKKVSFFWVKEGRGEGGKRGKGGQISKTIRYSKEESKQKKIECECLATYWELPNPWWGYQSSAPLTTLIAVHIETKKEKSTIGN